MSPLVIVSNRVPVPASDAAPSAGGLAVALHGLLERRGGLWFGWSGRIEAGASDQDVDIVRRGATEYATIGLSRTEHDRYYNNFSNGVLWPLLHTLPELMSFTRRDAMAYQTVNRRFAEALLPLLRPDDVIWVHDYHLMNLPALLRARGVGNPIGFFLHIPFCPSEVIAQIPNAGELISGLLASDLIGFQTSADLENFTVCARTLAHAAPAGPCALSANGHTSRLGVFPAEIDARAFAATATEATRTREAGRLARSLGKQSLILGVDRLDPTKGLPQRLAGFRRLLERHQEWQQRVSFLQIAALSRKDVKAYRDLKQTLEREAGGINADFGEPDWSPLRLITKAVPRASIAGFMRYARIGLVTPVHDGMNLVAKEYVAAQDPADPGMLILSQFAGAARQLDGAMLINPHDSDHIAEALDEGLRMPLAERQRRWKSMWKTLQEVSPELWGQSFVDALIEPPPEWGGTNVHPLVPRRA